MTSVPPPAQTSLTPASIQSTAPMLQNPITMTKVSWKHVLTSSEFFFDTLRSLFFTTYIILFNLCGGTSQSEDES